MSQIKIYKASAGSGKTYTLALEYIRELLLSHSEDHYRHVLAVTFTKDATGEMKDRILSELYGLAFTTADSAGFLASLQTALQASGYPLTDQQIRSRAERILHAILHDYSRLNITTIDSFFQKVLRNLARELGTGSKFNLEMNTEKALSEAVHATIEKANQNKQILEWLTTYIEHKMDEDRNWRIEQEIFSFSHCMYNEFFQEHEKELRKQIQENPNVFQELKQRQNEIKKVCKAFFIDTYQNIQSLLNASNLTAEDFIRKGLPIDFFRKLATGNYAAEVNQTILNCCEEAACWTSKTNKRRAEIEQLADSKLMSLLRETLDVQKQMLTSQMVVGNLHQLGLIWDISKEINMQNAENNRFMLSDTARFLHEMIDDSDAPFIYEKIGSDIRHVMIDEFQDTSRLQWQNFKALLSNIIATDRFSLIVGDVKQSIYRWRNGDWRILNSIGPELHAEEKTLGTNYRSDKTIVEFNNTFFLSAAGLLNQLHNQRLGETLPSPFLSTYNAEELVQASIQKAITGYVSIDFAEAEEDTSYSEAMKRSVLEQILKLYENGVPANEICILTRKNDGIIHLADYLSSMKDDYPELARQHYLDVISDEAFQLKSSMAVNIIIEALKVIAEPEDVVAAAVLESLTPGSSPQGRWKEDRLKMPLFELIGDLYRQFRLEELEGQSAYLFALYDSIAKYLNEKPADLSCFLQYWDDELQTKTIPAGSSVSGIRAMTIHKSKGLQFPTVIIPYCDWKIDPQFNPTLWCGAKEGLYNLALLPVDYNKTMADTVFAPEYKDETAQSWLDNLNLLYVGFTRAEKNLLILGKHKKNLPDFSNIRTVSDLLQLAIPSLAGAWDEETKHFETGRLAASLKQDANAAKDSDHPLKQIPASREVVFASEAFHAGKSIFKQSNQSREFVNANLSQGEGAKRL
ncbi:MAG: UvrD-helicase domain-containing protein, partial [Candidatus Symbiothrix sp.]|nr:UvrD-helicase domain-containing protein [Candidatus Symbiothrix sp.]